jgi:hypothetical protein
MPGEAALVGIGQELRKFRSAGGGPGDPGVHVLSDDRPTSRGGQGAQFFQLNLGSLLGCRDSGVKGNRKA